MTNSQPTTWFRMRWASCVPLRSGSCGTLRRAIVRRCNSRRLAHDFRPAQRHNDDAPVHGPFAVGLVPNCAQNTVGRERRSSAPGLWAALGPNRLPQCRCRGLQWLAKLRAGAPELAFGSSRLRHLHRMPRRPAVCKCALPDHILKDERARVIGDGWRGDNTDPARAGNSRAPVAE